MSWVTPTGAAGRRDHLNCKSGSGTSLDVPRSAKSDRMCQRSCARKGVVMLASETAANAIRDVMYMLSKYVHAPDKADRS